MVADATPVFVTAAVVFSLLAAWAIYVAVRPGAKWAQDAAPPPPQPIPPSESKE